MNGFATVGAGYLAPPVENPQVTKMIAETNRLARDFTSRKWPIFAFLDSHTPGKPEPPYPPHCEIGTGEENLAPDLLWLESDPNTTRVRNNCSTASSGPSPRTDVISVSEWVNGHKLEQILVVGVCTDICVMDFVLTLLSAQITIRCRASGISWSMRGPAPPIICPG